MKITLPEFLEAFPVPPPHHTNPKYEPRPWVFWSGSSAIDRAMMSSFLSITNRAFGYICQFWAPVSAGGRWLLSTSGQPFAVGFLSKELALYRQYSEKHKYCMDDVDNGGPSAAFWNGFPCVNQLQWIPSEVHPRLNVSIMFPVCFAGTNSIGVLELTGGGANLGCLGIVLIHSLKKAGLYGFWVEDHIPNETIGYGLKKEVNSALEVVCVSHNLDLAQVWIPYEHTQKKRLLALNWTGYPVAPASLRYNLFRAFSAQIPLAGDEVALKTLQDCESRYIPNFSSDMLIGWDGEVVKETSCFTICLRSYLTGDFDYAFEFIWTKDSSSFTTSSLEAMLLTLKKCLPRFKFASRALLGEEELDVVQVGGETPQTFKIFQGKSRPPLMILEELFDGSTSLEVKHGEFKLHFPTFVTLEKEISMLLGLSVGTYKIEYLDEDGEWIKLTCDEEMGHCITGRQSVVLLVSKKKERKRSFEIFSTA